MTTIYLITAPAQPLLLPAICESSTAKPTKLFFISAWERRNYAALTQAFTPSISNPYRDLMRMAAAEMRNEVQA